MPAASSIDLKAQNEQLLLEHAQLKKRDAERDLMIVALQRQLAQLQKMIFGSKQERFVPADVNATVLQGTLGLEAEAVATCSVVAAKKISYTRATTTTEQAPVHHPGRRKLPEHLRREEIIL